MNIKQKYIDRIVMQVETDINDIFNLKSEPYKYYLVERIIENHIVEMLDKIQELYK